MATSGWARTTGGARYNRTDLSKTSGWSPLAVDAFFPAASGTTTNKNLSYSGVGTLASTRQLVTTLSFTYNGIGTSTVSLLKVFLEAFAYSGVGTSSLRRLISRSFAYAALGTETVVKQVRKAFSYTGIGTLAYSDLVSFSKELLSSALGAVTFAKTFIGGGGGTVSTLLRRGKTIMLKFGRW